MSEITRDTPLDSLPELMTVRETATVGRSGDYVIRDLIRRGELPVVRLGRLIRIRRADWIEFIERGGAR